MRSTEREGLIYPLNFHWKGSGYYVFDGKGVVLLATKKDASFDDAKGLARLANLDQNTVAYVIREPKDATVFVVVNEE